MVSSWALRASSSSTSSSAGARSLDLNNAGLPRIVQLFGQVKWNGFFIPVPSSCQPFPANSRGGPEPAAVMSYGLSAGWDDDLLETSKGWPPVDTIERSIVSEAFRGRRGPALTKATELLWRVNDVARAAQVAAALEMPEEDEEMEPTTIFEAAEPPATSSSAPAKLGPSRGSCRLGLLAMPVSAGGTYQVRLLRTGRGPVPTRQTRSADLSAESLLQAQVEAGMASSVEVLPSGTPTTGTPALISPVGADAKVLLQKYSAVAADCFGDVASDAFHLAEALFGATLRGRGAEVLPRLSRWLSRVNQRTVKQYLETRRLPGGFGGKFTEAQCLEAVFHHLTANSIPAALHELRSLPGYDRLAAILAASGGTPLPGPQRRFLRQQLAEWKHQRRQADALMSPELWRIYSLLAGDLEVLRDCLDWRCAFGVVLWYGQCEEADVAEEDMLTKVVTSYLDAAKQQGMSSRIRPLPGYLQSTAMQDMSQSFQPVPRVGESIRPSDPPESLQFAAIRMAAGCSLGERNDVAHFDYQTYTKDPLDISLSWHFSVLMLALQGDEAARTACSGAAFQRLTQQYCKLLEQNGSSRWAVYVAHFLSEPRARSALVRQLLTSHARAGPTGTATELPWPELPPGWLHRAQALAMEQQRNWCGALWCWRKCGGEEARAITIACGYLLGPAMLGHAFSPFKRGAVEAILLAPMTPAARWLLQSLEELSGAMGCHDVFWAEVGRDTLELLRDWSEASADGAPAKFQPQRLVRLHWKCERLRKCMLGFPQ
eukprot:s63_g32.t1